ncbi:MAG TPA: hypothetical protein VL119_06090 [Acidimicrobiia bacterium]|nr:hypothetical protein [Acidimicrobiia bacterium]
MSKLRRFGRFWYDFIVGDDWIVAAAVVAAVVATTLLAHHGRNPWILMPLAVTATLGLSVRRVAIRARRERRSGGS